METIINVVEAKANFSELMIRVAYQGQRVIVERHGRPQMAWISMDDLAHLKGQADPSEIQAQRRAALALAVEIRERIRAERQGQPLADSAELIHELREGSLQ